MTTTPPEPPEGGAPGYGTPPPPGYDPNAGYGAPPAYGGVPGGGMPAAPGVWAGPPLAEWGSRVGATLIDLVVMVVPYIILTLISDALGLLAYIGIWLYLRYLEGTTGQSIGKKVLNIKVLRERDGQVIGFGMAVLRAILHILDGFCFIGYLWPLWDAKKQTFADKILQTVVVKA